MEITSDKGQTNTTDEGGTTPEGGDCNCQIQTNDNRRGASFGIDGTTDTLRCGGETNNGGDYRTLVKKEGGDEELCSNDDECAGTSDVAVATITEEAGSLVVIATPAAAVHLIPWNDHSIANNEELEDDESSGDTDAAVVAPAYYETAPDLEQKSDYQDQQDAVEAPVRAPSNSRRVSKTGKWGASRRMSVEQRRNLKAKTRETYHRLQTSSQREQRARERQRHGLLLSPETKEREARRTKLNRERYKRMTPARLAAICYRQAPAQVSDSSESQQRTRSSNDKSATRQSNLILHLSRALRMK